MSTDDSSGKKIQEGIRGIAERLEEYTRRDAARKRNELALNISVRLLEAGLKGGKKLAGEETNDEWAQGWAKASNALIEAHLGPLVEPEKEEDDGA